MKHINKMLSFLLFSVHCSVYMIKFNKRPSLMKSSLRLKNLKNSLCVHLDYLWHTINNIYWLTLMIIIMHSFFAGLYECKLQGKCQNRQALYLKHCAKSRSNTFMTWTQKYANNASSKLLKSATFEVR